MFVWVDSASICGHRSFTDRDQNTERHRSTSLAQRPPQPLRCYKFNRI